MERILSMVHEEIERRENLDQQAQQRREEIRREYQPLHPDLYRWEVNIRKEPTSEHGHQLFSRRSSRTNSKSCVQSPVETIRVSKAMAVSERLSSLPTNSKVKCLSIYCRWSVCVPSVYEGFLSANDRRTEAFRNLTNAERQTKYDESLRRKSIELLSIDHIDSLVLRFCSTN